MKILIFGANGWIGSQFRDVCDRATLGGSDIQYQASQVKNVSLSTQNEVIEEIANYMPTHVVSFLGRTHGKIGDRVYSTIDYLEQDDKLSENLRDNLVAPLLLAYICKYANVHFTYLGTGCIFHYTDDDLERMLNYDRDIDGKQAIELCYKFKESDSPNFVGSSYSIVKGLTDKIMQERNCICENVLNLRIRMPIVNKDNPRNFITKIAGYSKICSLPNSMTVLDEFLPYALVLMQCRYAGTLNFVNPGVISHNEMLELYKEHVDSTFTWKNFTVEEQNQILSSKRSNNYLDNTKLISLFPKVKHIRDAVVDCMKTYNSNSTSGVCEIKLSHIECSARIQRWRDEELMPSGHNNPGSFYNHPRASKMLQKGGDIIVNAAQYATQCTRILSETVGTLYSKMLAAKSNRMSELQLQLDENDRVSGSGGKDNMYAMRPRSLAVTVSDAQGVQVVDSVSDNNNNTNTHSAEPGVTVEFIDPVVVTDFESMNTLIDDASTVILVTGGAGFIGSHFVNFIHSKYQNIKIVNIDCLYYCANIFNVNLSVRDDPESRYKFYKIDLAETDAVKTLASVLQSHSVTHVVHFAAQSHVQNSFGESLQYTRDNVMGTHNLLEAARLYGSVKRFVHVSTDEVYGESMIHDTKTDCKTESSVLSPTNPYAATKAAAEMIAQSYYHSFKLPLIITRGNNVYGPNQYPEKLIPKFIKLLEDDKKLTVQGNGSNIRSFIHVFDVCRAFDIILSRGEIGEIYNIGGDDSSEYSVIDVAKILIHEIKGVNIDFIEGASDLDWIEYIDDRPFNDKRYYISNHKLKKLGWTTEIDFIDGIRMLVKRKTE
jgi:dTDP-glucose 4,6-dehydratase